MKKINSKLAVPIKIGDVEFKEIEIRLPNSGELRGVSMSDLLQLEATALIRVLSRVTNPMLSELEIDQTPASNLLAMGTDMVGLLMGE